MSRGRCRGILIGVRGEEREVTLVIKSSCEDGDVDVDVDWGERIDTRNTIKDAMFMTRKFSVC
jgi:hypothetical protein